VGGLLLFGWLWRQAAASQWRGEGDFSYLEQPGDYLTVATLIPEYSKLINWQIPGNTLVEVSGGYGSYQLKNVFALGQIDGRGGPTLQQTSQEALGLKLDGWRANGATNLSWLDQLRIWYFRQFKAKQTVTLDLGQTPAWQVSTLTDGSQVFKVVEYQLDQIINQETFSQEIAQEGLSVSVVNDRGLSRVIRNHGIELVTVSSQADPADQTTIWVKEAGAKNSRTVAWLKRLLPQASVVVGAKEDFWSAIVIVLGKDYN
jgi:hypothetical protein